MNCLGTCQKPTMVLLLGWACCHQVLAQRDYLVERCSAAQLRAGGGSTSGSEFRLIAWDIPATATPGQTVTSAVVWETDRGNPNAVVFATVIGDWAPGSPIATLVDGGMQGQPGNRFEAAFRFEAPSRPGTYRVRWILTQAFRPVTVFYGKPDGGASDPGGGTWAEAQFTIARGERDFLAERCSAAQLQAGSRGTPGSEFRLVAWEMPTDAGPGDTLTSRVVWETDRGNPNAVIYATAIGDWAPSSPLAILVDGGMQGGPGNRFERTFRFEAPSLPGTYRVRWILTQAFRPLTLFYGKPDGGASDPGGGTWAETQFTVRGAAVHVARSETRPCDWYMGKIRETVQNDGDRERLMRAMRSVIDIRERTTGAQENLTYAALKAAGSLVVSTPSGSRSLEELARERVLREVPGLAGSDIVEDPAMVVAALLVSDRAYFIHEMKIVPVDGEYLSISTALERRSGLDPALTRELISMVEAADALSRGEDVFQNMQTLQRGLNALRSAATNRDRYQRDSDVPESRSHDDARDRERRDQEAREQQLRREEAARREEQQRQEREAADRRRAEEERARADHQRALAESAAHHPLGLALETLTEDTRKTLGLFAGTRGVAVLYVQPGSAGDQAGVRPGMVIESVDQRTVGSRDEFDSRTANKRSGDQFSIGVWQKSSGRWERANKIVSLRR